MRGNHLGWAQIRMSRFRQSARGKATWLAADVRGTDPLPPLPPRTSAPVTTGPVDEDGEPIDAPPTRARPRASLMPERIYQDDVPVLDPDLSPPILPAWVGHPAAALRRVLGLWAHIAAFHALRTPQYAAQAVRWSPRGLYRCVVGVFRWVTDGEGRELRWESAARGDAKEYLHLSRQRNQRVHNRGWAAGIGVSAVVGVVGYGVAVSPGSPATAPAVVLLVVLGLGAIGAPADRPWIEHATVSPSARRITPDLLIQAFAAAKLCSLDADRPPGPIRFRSPIAHDGPGVRAIIELPAGVTATDAIGKREKIASGLDLDEFRVFLERVRGTAGSARQVVAWIADRDPYETPSAITPLAVARTWDFWRPFPFGLDARGRVVELPLVWSSLLVGAIPRMGKTNAARIPAAAAVLDPTARVIVFDGKGGKDWKPFETVAHFYAAGVRQTVVEALVAVLQDTVEDMNRRYETMADLPDDVCPEGKVTPQITRRAHYGMPLTVICIDEVQRYLEHPEHGGTIFALLTELAKAAPAAGIMLVLATQRPDAKTVPESLRAQMGTRFALRVMSWQASDTILGAGAYADGQDASKFLRTHLGVGILVGADDTQATGGDALTVRTHILDITTLRQICARGRELRVKAGTLTGMAAGETVIPDTPQRRLLDDLLDVFEPGEDRCWSETLCARLAKEWPDVYDGWDPTTLANTLRAFGVETAQTWGRTGEGGGANRRGVTRQRLLDVIAEREHDRAASA